MYIGMDLPTIYKKADHFCANRQKKKRQKYKENRIEILTPKTSHTHSG
jgi:hypothetical protein